MYFYRKEVINLPRKKKEQATVANPICEAAAPPEPLGPKQARENLEREKAVLAEMQKEVKAKEASVEELEEILRNEFEAYADELMKYTNEFLEKVYGDETLFDVLKRVVIAADGDIGTGASRWYEFAFCGLDTGTIRTGQTINSKEQKNFAYVNLDASDGMQSEVVRAIDECVAREMTVIRMPYPKHGWNQDYIAITIAYFYRKYGDIGRALLETKEMYKDAEYRDCADTIRYLYELP